MIGTTLAGVAGVAGDAAANPKSPIKTHIVVFRYRVADALPIIDWKRCVQKNILPVCNTLAVVY